MANFLSPGVITRVYDFSTYMGRESDTSVGMVGGAEKGPINVPTLCISPSDFETKFGKPIGECFGPISAFMFLLRGSKLWYTRTVNETAEAYAKAVYKVAGKDGSDGDIDDILMITMKEHGTYGNRFKVTIVPDSSNARLLTVTIFNEAGFAVEEHIVDLSFTYIDDSADPDYVPMETILDGINDHLAEIRSSYVTFEADFDETLVSVPAVSEPVAFTGGNNGLSGLTADHIVKSLNQLDNPDTVPIDLLLAPGQSEKKVVERMLEICEDRHDCFAIVDPPMELTVSQVIEYHNGELTGTGMPDSPLDTYYGGIYYPWVKVFNEHSGTEDWIPPSGIVAGAFAFNDREGAPWFAPAGLNRAMLGLVRGVERDLTKDDMDNLYGHPTRRINPIINYKNEGFTIWGQKTLQIAETSLNRVNVARLLLNVRKTVAISSAYVLFDQNDEFTWSQWKGMVEPYLRAVKSRRGLYDFQVVMDSSTVTPEHIDNNIMPGKIALQPTRSAEWLVVDFVLTKTGVDFSSV